MRLRFPKSARLTRSSEFLRVKNEGESCHGRFMVLSVLKSGGNVTRVGFITSRRVGNAVTRNRVRRRLREIVRLSRPRLKPGSWLVLVARSHAAGASHAAILGEWLKLAGRTAIFQSPTDATEHESNRSDT
jgi:ribonuclease P protein component